MNTKILVFGIVVILNFSAFYVLANDIGVTVIDGGSISGYVRQVNGNPISDATIELIRQDNTGWWKTYSVSDGSYIFTALPNGNYIIRAFKNGYAREYYNNALYAMELEHLRMGMPGNIIIMRYMLWMR
jgi:hypothetical protein